MMCVMRFGAVAILCALAQPGVALGADQAAAQEETPEPGPIVIDGKKEKKICTREVTTGSIMSRRVCRTQSEIDRQQANAARAMDDARNQQMTRRHIQDNRE